MADIDGALRTVAAMDFARVHTGVRCGEVVPFGFGDQPIIPGGYVHEVAGISGRASRQIAMREGGFVLVRDSIFCGWFDSAASDVICLGWHGRPATLADISCSSRATGTAQMTAYLRNYASDVFIARNDAVSTARALAALIRAKRCDLIGVPYRCETCDQIRSSHPPQGDIVEQCATSPDAATWCLPGTGTRRRWCA